MSILQAADTLDASVCARKYKVALASCTLPEFTEKERYVNELVIVQKALLKLDIECDIVPWSLPDVHWEMYDAVVIAQTWDYTADFPKFTSWLKEVSLKCKLMNDFPILNWSSDKVYLKKLSDAGIPVVPTVWVDAADASSQVVDLCAIRQNSNWGEERGVIIKPAVGCSSEGILYLPGSAPTASTAALNITQTDSANAHIQQQLQAGQTHLLIQPFLDAIKTFGEISAVYIDGEYSHALLKTPSSTDFRVQAEYGGTTRVVEATPAMKKVCDHVMRVVNLVCVQLGTEPVLYARIDLIPCSADVSTGYYVCEVELLEPELFFQDSMDYLQRSRDVGADIDFDAANYEWSHVRYAKGIAKRLLLA